MTGNVREGAKGQWALTPSPNPLKGKELDWSSRG